MPTARERYTEALTLAKSGKYTAALDILETIDHVKARDLESQIHTRLAAQSPVRTWSARRVIALVVFTAFVATASYLAYLSYQQQRGYELYSAVVSICWDAYNDTLGAERFDYCREAVPRAIELYHDAIRACYDQYGSDANPVLFVRCMADNGVTL